MECSCSFNEGTDFQVPDSYCGEEHCIARGCKVQTSMNKEGTQSLIARAVKRHKKRVTSRGTQCLSEGPGQSIRLKATKRKGFFLEVQEMKISYSLREKK